jgi:hypothetical protein
LALLAAVGNTRYPGKFGSISCTLAATLIVAG